MNVILLHGAVGIWDEVACLALPATVVLAVAVAVLREKPLPADVEHVADSEAGSDADRPETAGGRGME